MPQYAQTQPKEVEIEYEGQKVKLNVRELTYTEILAAIDSSYEISFDPATHRPIKTFSLSKYWREVVSRVFSGSAPWNDKAELLKVSPSWAQVLEGLIPDELINLKKLMGVGDGDDEKKSKDSSEDLKSP